MKVPHLRHTWVIDGGPGDEPRRRCAKCGKTKDNGVPADRRSVTEARAAKSKHSADWPASGGAAGM
ncbi:MAG TPA: hypothetical protein VFG72_04590 [Marmoricola sp.]|nr:hypothetical protein [Marmoricola sp.]